MAHTITYRGFEEAEFQDPMPGVSNGKLAMWLFLVSDSMSFIGLLVAYAAVRWTFPEDLSIPQGLGTTWKPDQWFGFFGIQLTALNTFILICSSVTMVQALAAFQENQLGRGRQFLALTVLGGSIFLGIQAYEWTHMIGERGMWTATGTVHDSVGWTKQTKGAYRAEIVAGGLNNPSGVSFDDAGMMIVCDSGNGQVLRVDPLGTHVGKLTNFKTEHWKVTEEDGKEVKRFKLGPLGALSIDGHLYVTDGGQKDGEERVLVYKDWKAKKPEKKSETYGKEGNLCGLSVSPDHQTIYLCGQGEDDKSLVLKYDVKDGKKLSKVFSADEQKIDTNSPMATIVNGEKLLVLFSGAGGKADGRIVEWDLKANKLGRQWTLPGVEDPMGMALVPGATNQLAVVGNNWSLTEVNDGKLARVELPEKSGKAKVTVLATKLQGPTACAFHPWTGTLYVTQLGRMFDQGVGNVLAITGFAGFQHRHYVQHAHGSGHTTSMQIRHAGKQEWLAVTPSNEYSAMYHSHDVTTEKPGVDGHGHSHGDEGHGHDHHDVYLELHDGHGHALPIGQAAPAYTDKVKQVDFNLQAATFYITTGFHGCHVFGGVVLLLLTLLLGMAGHSRWLEPNTIEVVGLYWHFVDLVWILIFTFVYLV